MMKTESRKGGSTVNFDRIAPDVRSVYLHRRKQNTKTVTDRKYSYAYKLSVILEGSFILRIDSREEECKAGDIFYLPACRDYITDFPSSPLRLINIEFDMIHDRGQEFKPLLQNFVLGSQDRRAEMFSTVVTFDDLPTFNDCFVLRHFPGAVKRAQQCLELYGSRDRFARLMLNAQLTELLIKIAEHIDQAKKTPTAVIAERVMDYIEAHCMEKLTCERVAAEFAYHPASLNRIMREFYHCSVHKAITHAKINSAAQLLTESDMSVTDIAYHLSFYDSAHFTKTFREVMGCNPSDLRKKEG